MVTTLVFVDPERVRVSPPCPVRAVTGLDCPGCGATRCMFDLVHGDVAAAVDHNPLTVMALPVLVVALVLWWAPSLRRPWMSRVLSSRVTTWGVLVVVVAFAIVRNTPTPIGRYLASG